MLLIKEKLLSLYTRQLVYSSKTIRLNVGYPKAQLIGLLYTKTNVQKDTMILQLIQKIQKLGKHVQILTYFPKVSKSNNHQSIEHLFPYFMETDINFLGQLLGHQLKTFIHTSFDYLYHVDLESNTILDFLLAKCQAKCRVGSFNINRANFFEIMIHCKAKDHSTLENLLAEMLHYTQLL